MLTWSRLIQRSLQHHLRIHGAVALGVAAATAVLTGALIVGDSVRGSLRDLALDQLGKIDEILVTEQFFREELAEEMQTLPFQLRYKSATPIVLFPNGTIQSTNEKVQRAGQVLVVGCDERFWRLGELDAPTIGFDDIVLNEPLAKELKVGVGDEVLLRLPKSNAIPGDSALAHDTESQTLAGLKVVAVLPAKSLGRFSLRPNQSEPRNAFVSMERLQDALDQPGKANAVLIASKQARPPSEEESKNLTAALIPSLADYGISVDPVKVQWTEEGNTKVVADYFNVSTSRLVFDPTVEKILKSTLESTDAQSVSTYMAITIGVDGSDAVGIPYSTISGIEANDAFPIVDINGKTIQLQDDEVVLNQWAADQLSAKVGDTISLTYFAPETTHGEEEEWEDSLTLRGIVPLAEPQTAYDPEVPREFDAAPSPFNDPHFTPTVQGITDEDSISDWDPPFRYEPNRIKPRDDTYWELHRTTPKAFVSLDTAARLWSSRFGLTTSFRVPRREGLEPSQLQEQIRSGLHQAGNPGFVFTPVKRQAYAASGGTTPFDGLFIALSFFIIAAALILVSLLFQLGIEQRASEIGSLLAVGMSRKRMARLLTTEGVAVAGVGALLGIALGVGYAALMITGLKHWWVDAIATPFLEMHVLFRSLLIGYLLGVIVCVVTIYVRLRSMRRMSIRRLLSGEATEERGPGPQPTGRTTWIGVMLLISAVGLGFAAANYLGGEAQAGGFVGSGALLLFAALLLLWNRLRSRPTLANAGSLGALARRNAARNPTRSTMVIGLMAVASFLIVAMSAFRLAPTLQGSGGFQLIGESSQPVKQDLNDPLAREDAGLAELKDVTILSLRLQPGDDASCRNLYQSTRPRVLGVSRQMVQYYDQPREFAFQWGATAAKTPEEEKNRWRLLESNGDGPIPMVLDKNTAMYSLHLLGGVGQQFSIEYPDGQKVDFEVVGLLSNSVLQGNVLIGELAFQRTYPNVEGYRFFLASGPNPDSLQEAMEEAFSQRGLDMKLAADVLRDLLSVQNTYLSTFQSLGLLGLLLGTFGLATVQLRSVFERRKELALMRAAGFQRKQLAGMVMRENLVLLAMGLITGAVAALVAILPYGLTTGTDIPWRSLFWMLGAVLVTGILTGLFAVRATLKAPLVAALRGE